MKIFFKDCMLRMGPLVISKCLKLDNLSSKESNLLLNIVVKVSTKYSSKVLLLLLSKDFSASLEKINVEPKWEVFANLCT